VRSQLRHSCPALRSPEAKRTTRRRARLPLRMLAFHPVLKVGPRTIPSTIAAKNSASAEESKVGRQACLGGCFATGAGHHFLHGSWFWADNRPELRHLRGPRVGGRNGGGAASGMGLGDGLALLNDQYGAEAAARAAQSRYQQAAGLRLGITGGATGWLFLNDQYPHGGGGSDGSNRATAGGGASGRASRGGATGCSPQRINIPTGGGGLDGAIRATAGWRGKGLRHHGRGDPAGSPQRSIPPGSAARREQFRQHRGRGRGSGITAGATGWLSSNDRYHHGRRRLERAATALTGGRVSSFNTTGQGGTVRLAEAPDRPPLGQQFRIAGNANWTESGACWNSPFPRRKSRQTGLHPRTA